MSGEVIFRTARPAISLSAYGAVGAVQTGSAGVRLASGMARGVKRRIEERVERAEAVGEGGHRHLHTHASTDTRFSNRGVG